MWWVNPVLLSAFIHLYHLSIYLMLGPEPTWRTILSRTYVLSVLLSVPLQSSSESVSERGFCFVRPSTFLQWCRDVGLKVARWMEFVLSNQLCRICSVVLSTQITLKGPCFYVNKCLYPFETERSAAEGKGGDLSRNVQSPTRMMGKNRTRRS